MESGLSGLNGQPVASRTVYNWDTDTATIHSPRMVEVPVWDWAQSLVTAAVAHSVYVSQPMVILGVVKFYRAGGFLECSIIPPIHF